MRYEEAKLLSGGSVDEQDGGTIRRITFFYYIGWNNFPLAIFQRGHSFIRLLDQPEPARFLEHFDANALSPLARHRSSRIEIMDLD